MPNPYDAFDDEDSSVAVKENPYDAFDPAPSSPVIDRVPDEVFYPTDQAAPSGYYIPQPGFPPLPIPGADLGGEEVFAEPSPRSTYQRMRGSGIARSLLGAPPEEQAVRREVFAGAEPTTGEVLQAALPQAMMGGLIRGLPAAVMGGKYLFDQIMALPDQFKELKDAVSAGDSARAIKAAMDLGMNAAMVAAVPLAAKYGAAPETKGPNASGIKEAAEVHGDVRPFPIEGEGQVSAKEGGPGVQPRTPEETQVLLGEHAEVLNRNIGDKPVTYTTLPEGKVARANFDTGEIEIDPAQFKTWMDKDLGHLTPEQKEVAVRTMLEHEDIHLKTPPEEGEPFWNSLSAFEQWVLKRQYLKGGGRETDQNLGMEAIRNRIERAMKLTRSDFLNLVGVEKWTAQSLDHLSAIVARIRQLGSRSLSEYQKGVLDKVLGNLEAARIIQAHAPTPPKPDELTDDEKAELQASFDEVNADIADQPTDIENLSEAAGISKTVKPRVQPAPEPEGMMRIVEQIRILKESPEINTQEGQDQLKQLEDELRWEKKRKYPGMRHQLDPDEMAKREPGETTHEELMALSDEDAVKFFKGIRTNGNSPQHDAVAYGMKLGPEAVPELVRLRDEAHKAGMDKIQAGVKSGEVEGVGQAAMGKVVWLNGAIEGASRKGPNYEGYFANRIAELKAGLKGGPESAKQPIPDWVRERMIQEGMDTSRTFNDVDLRNQSVRDAILSDPTLTERQKQNMLRTGSAGPAMRREQKSKEELIKDADGFIVQIQKEMDKWQSQVDLADLRQDEPKKVEALKRVELAQKTLEFVKNIRSKLESTGTDSFPAMRRKPTKEELQAKLDAMRAAAAAGKEPPKLAPRAPQVGSYPTVKPEERVGAVEAGALPGPGGPRRVAPLVEGPVTPDKAKFFTYAYLNEAETPSRTHVNVPAAGPGAGPAELATSKGRAVMPDWDDYKVQFQTRFGPTPEGAMRDFYKSGLMNYLINAKGERLSKLIRGANVSGRFAGRGRMPGEVIPSSSRKIADPEFITTELGPQLALDLEGAKTVEGKTRHLKQAVKRAQEATQLEYEYRLASGRAIQLRSELRSMGVSDVTLRGDVLDLNRKRVANPRMEVRSRANELASIRRRMDELLDPDKEAREKLLSIKEQQTGKKSGEEEGMMPRSAFEPRPPPKSKTFNRAQQLRLHVVATLYDVLAGKADETRKSASRTEITPDDLGSQIKAKEPVFYAISARETRRPDDLAQRLVRDARSSGEKVSLTHRLVAMVSKDSGRVELVDVYLDPRRGPVAMSTIGTGVHQPLETIFKTHRPIYSIYLDEPVVNFRKRFASVREFEEKFGREVTRRMSGAEYAFAGKENKYLKNRQEQIAYEPKSGTAPSKNMLEREMAGPLREDQADAVYSSILQEVNSFERPQEVIDTISGIHEMAQRQPLNRLNLKAIAGFQKMFEAVRAAFPQLSDDQVMEQMALQIYDTHFTSGDYQDFINKSIRRFGGQAERAGEEGPGPAMETKANLVRTEQQKAQQAAEQKARYFASRKGLDEWLRSRQGLSPSEYEGRARAAIRPPLSKFTPPQLPLASAPQELAKSTSLKDVLGRPVRRSIPGGAGPPLQGITAQAADLSRLAAAKAATARESALTAALRAQPREGTVGGRAVSEAYRMKREAIAEAEKENFAEYQAWKKRTGSKTPYREWRAKKSIGHEPKGQYKVPALGEFKEVEKGGPESTTEGPSLGEFLEGGEAQLLEPEAEGPAMRREMAAAGRKVWDKLKTPGILDRQAIVPDFSHQVPRLPENINEALTRATGIETVPIVGRVWGPRANIRDPVDRAIVGYAVKRNMGNSLAALNGKMLKDLETRLGQPFKQTPDGEFTNVDSVKGASLRPSDVFEAWQRQVVIPEQMQRTPGIQTFEINKYKAKNPLEYQLTRPQEAFFRTLYDHLRDGYKYIEEKNAGLEPGEYRQPKLIGFEGDLSVYPFPRVALHKKGQGSVMADVRRRIGGAYKIENERLYETERRGSETTVYEPDMVNRMVVFMSRVYKSVADADLAKDPNLKGETFAEARVRFAKEYEAELKSHEMSLDNIEKMSRQGRLGIESRVEDHPAFYGKIFPIAIANKLARAFGEQTHVGVRTLGQASRLLKAMELTADFAQFMQQGMPTLIRHPSIWAKATRGSLQALSDPNVLGRTLRNPNLARGSSEFIQHGGTLAYLQDFMSGASPGELAARIPGVRQIVLRSGQSFGTFLDLSKLYLWESLKKGVPADQLPELAEQIENIALSGRMESAGMHPGRALAERIVLMAPSYYRAAFQHVAAAMEGAFRLATGTGAQHKAQVEALKTFATFMAGIHALMWGAYTAAGMDNQEKLKRLIPGGSKYLRFPVKVGSRVIEIGPGGIILDLVKLTGEVVDTSINSPEDFLTGGPRNPFIGWFNRKLGPAPAWAKENFITGKDFSGRDTTLLRSTTEKVMPISAQTAYETSRKQELPAAATESAASFLGLQATTRSPASDLREIVDSYLKQGATPKEKALWKQHRNQQDVFVSDYRPLRDALIHRDLGEARQEYNKLLAIKGNSKQSAEKMIDEAMNPKKGTITGMSKEMEKSIKDRMTSAELKIYQDAQNEKELLYELFREISD